VKKPSCANKRVGRTTWPNESRVCSASHRGSTRRG